MKMSTIKDNKNYDRLTWINFGKHTCLIELWCLSWPNACLVFLLPGGEEQHSDLQGGVSVRWEGIWKDIMRNEKNEGERSATKKGRNYELKHLLRIKEIETGKYIQNEKGGKRE